MAEISTATRANSPQLIAQEAGGGGEGAGRIPHHQRSGGRSQRAAARAAVLGKPVPRNQADEARRRAALLSPRRCRAAARHPASALRRGLHDPRRAAHPQGAGPPSSCRRSGSPARRSPRTGPRTRPTLPPEDVEAREQEEPSAAAGCSACCRRLLGGDDDDEEQPREPSAMQQEPRAPVAATARRAAAAGASRHVAGGLAQAAGRAA